MINLHDPQGAFTSSDYPVSATGCDFLNDSAELKHLSKKANSLLERSMQSLSVSNKLIHGGVLAAVHMPPTCEKRLKLQTLVI